VETGKNAKTKKADQGPGGGPSPAQMGEKGEALEFTEGDQWEWGPFW